MNNLCIFSQSFVRICSTLVVMLWLGALSVGAATYYVATNGNHTTYTDWASAATNIQAAVTSTTINANDIVLVSNGVYTASVGPIVNVTNATITLKSVNGPDVTIIDGGSVTQCVWLSTNSTLDGFTVRNGKVAAYGGGIRLANGTVTNCLIYNNLGNSSGGGIGIFNAYGYIFNCMIYSNTSKSYGGGMYAATWTQSGHNDSMIKNCVFFGNKCEAGSGGGLNSASAYLTIRNCLFYRNDSYGSGGGASVSANDGYDANFENCMITANTASNTGGGFYTIDITHPVRNSIIWNNSATNCADVSALSNNLTKCCIGNTNGVPNWNTSGNITNNPQFIDAANNNYRLLGSSPCINTGTNQSWMTNGIDLDGQTRIRYGTVDMGAYEKIYEGTIYKFH